MSLRVYTVSFLAGTIPATNALDLFEITPADDRPVRILGMSLDNVGVGADAGDAQEELLSISVYRGFTVSGSGGSAPTPFALDHRGVAAGFTAETLNTVVATTSGVSGIPFGWNVRIPLREFWPEELQMSGDQSNTTLVVRLAAGGADVISANGCLWVAEVV